jgi:hypothetical protein
MIPRGFAGTRAFKGANQQVRLPAKRNIPDAAQGSFNRRKNGKTPLLVFVRDNSSDSLNVNIVRPVGFIFRNNGDILIRLFFDPS